MPCRATAQMIKQVERECCCVPHRWCRGEDELDVRQRWAELGANRVPASTSVTQAMQHDHGGRVWRRRLNHQGPRVVEGVRLCQGPALLRLEGMTCA